MEHRSKTKKYDVEEIKEVNIKSHFGPEENEEVHDYINRKKAEQQEKIRNAYLQQIHLSSLDRRLEKEIERA